PRPPPSTLLPYTTLFRSDDGGHETAIYRAALANLVVPLDPSLGLKLSPVLVEVTRRHPSRLFSIGGGAAAAGAGLKARIGAICQDRKSTRLNSSHRTISY